MASFVVSYILLSFTVFAISSGWLYSEGPSTFRNWWLKTFTGKLKYLAICQLCCSFWITLMLEWLFLPDWGPVHYILNALSVSGISWALGSFTLMCLNLKWAAEEHAKNRWRRIDDLK
jgi:ABC-type Co2+ transport system permease subunit